MAIFKKPAIKIQDRKKRDIPQGLFQKCPGCDEVIHEIELIENQRVCPHCDYHFPQTAKELIDAVLSGYGMLEGVKVAIAVMDFTFLAATMGSVVGERVTRMIEFATAERIAIIIISASGGARMYEGM